MKPHPRIRKTVKWGGAAVTVALLGALGVSAWGYIYFMTAGGSGVAIADGGVGVSHCAWCPSPSYPPGFGAGRTHTPFRWRLECDNGGSFHFLLLPLWLPAIPAALASTAAAFLDTRARRRAMAHLCAKCGYDRTGLAAGAKCPECGSVPA